MSITRRSTVEGLARGEQLDPVQQAFVEADAYQCGFCTPGQIMSIAALLAEQHAPSEDEVKRAVSGNLVLGRARGVLAGVGLYWRLEKWLRRQERLF